MKFIYKKLTYEENQAGGIEALYDIAHPPENYSTQGDKHGERISITNNRVLRQVSFDPFKFKDPK